MTDIRINQSIERIYGTITNPNQWYSILEDMCDQYALKGANIFCWDINHQELTRAWMSKYLDDMFPTYMASGYLEEETKAFINAAGVDDEPELVNIVDWAKKLHSKNGVYVDIDAINNWLANNMGIHSRYTSSMNAKPGYSDFITLHAGEHYQSKATKLIGEIGLLLPHIRQAIYINRPFSLLQQRYNEVLEVLDKFKLGVIITDEKLNILMHNVSADAIIF